MYQNIYDFPQYGEVCRHRRGCRGVGSVDNDTAPLEAAGLLIAEHTPGGHRRYDLSKLRPEQFRATSEAARKTVAYARVSSHDRKKKQTFKSRQKQVLELYCAQQGWAFEVVADLDGHELPQEGPQKVCWRRSSTAMLDSCVIAHKDRLLRFGAELVFAICRSRERRGGDPQPRRGYDFRGRFRQRCFRRSSRYFRRGSTAHARHENQRLLDGVKRAVDKSASC